MYICIFSVDSGSDSEANEYSTVEMWARKIQGENKER